MKIPLWGDVSCFHKIWGIMCYILFINKLHLEKIWPLNILKVHKMLYWNNSCTWIIMLMTYPCNGLKSVTHNVTDTYITLDFTSIVMFMNFFTCFTTCVNCIFFQLGVHSHSYQHGKFCSNMSCSFFTASSQSLLHQM